MDDRPATRRRAAMLTAAAVAALLVVVFLAVGRGWFGRSPGAPGSGQSGTGSATVGLLPGGGYQAVDQQQAGDCDGVPAVPQVGLRLLDPAATVIAAVVCADDYTDLPGRGRWLVRRLIDVPPASLPVLVAAVTSPNRNPGAGVCDSSLLITPGFVLTLADGTRVRPGLPGDGCHVTALARDALQAAAASAPARSTVPVSQVAAPDPATVRATR